MPPGKPKNYLLEGYFLFSHVSQGNTLPVDCILALNYNWKWGVGKSTAFPKKQGWGYGRKKGLMGLSQSFHPSIISTVLTASLFITRYSGRDRDRDSHYNNFRVSHKSFTHQRHHPSKWRVQKHWKLWLYVLEKQ